MDNRFSISFIGKSNSGKTTVIVGVIDRLSGMGFAVSAVKHSGKNVQMDQSGKDSWRFKKAGARGVVLYAEDKLFYNLSLEKNMDVRQIIGMLAEPVDIVIVEGFKNSGLPAIVVINSPEHVRESLSFKNITAIVSDIAIPGAPPDIPVFKRDDITGITAFILKKRDDFKLRISPCQVD